MPASTSADPAAAIADLKKEWPKLNIPAKARQINAILGMGGVAARSQRNCPAAQPRFGTCARLPTPPHRTISSPGRAESAFEN
jgi:hypothetical protein